MSTKKSFSSCPVCTKPFNSTKNIPKLLRCSHSICVSCLYDHCLTDTKNAVICLKCAKRTYLEGVYENNWDDALPNKNNDEAKTITQKVNITPENGLITNYRFLLHEHSEMTEKIAVSTSRLVGTNNNKNNNNNNNNKNNNNNNNIAAEDKQELLGGSDDEEEDEDAALAFLADCEAPGCEEKAQGRCEGCAGAAFCNSCYEKHLSCLPRSVKEKHNFGSVADSQLCPKHKLPRQLFCMHHNKAICATCASLHHRSCKEIRELTSVVETLRPQISERQEKMFELFKVALNSCYELKNEMKRIDEETDKTVENLLESALKCVSTTLESAYNVQLSALRRKIELDHALRTLSVEAGNFAEEVEEIKILLYDGVDENGNVSSNPNHHPDPVKVARHAPSEKPALHTIIPSGNVLKSELVFEVREDLQQFWQRRGAATIPELTRRKNPAAFNSMGNESSDYYYSPKTTNNHNNNNVVMTNRETSSIKTIPTKIQTKFGNAQGTSAETFSFPRGMATLPNGNIAICDTNNHRIQIINPTAIYSSSSAKNAEKESFSPSQNMKATKRSKKEQIVGSFVTFIPLRVQTGAKADDKRQNIFAYPSLVCTLPNGNLFVLDNENRCAYFIDAMQKMDQYQGQVWNFPSQWIKPSGMCVLPATGEVVVIDEARHFVSVLDKELQNVVREFDGVDLIDFTDNNNSNNNNNNNNRKITSSQHHHNFQQDLVHEDMIHRIDCPKAICAIPLFCPWGENVFDTLFDDVSTLAYYSSSSSSASPNRNTTTAANNNNNNNYKLNKTQSMPSSTFDEEEIRLLRKQKKLQESEEVSAEIVGDFNQTKYTVLHRDPNLHFLIAICSETRVSILDAKTGAFVRFIGGDASKQKVISRPWGICASEDGKRLAIVDGVQSCLYIAGVQDGEILMRVAYHNNLTFFGGSKATNENLQLNVSTYSDSQSGQTSRSNSTSQISLGHHGNNNNNNNRTSTSLLHQQTPLSLSPAISTATSFFPQNITLVPANGKLIVTDVVSHSVCILETVL